MMSKNSFWANMRENLKRRNWIMVIYTIVFLFVFPVGMTVWITSQEQYKKEMTLTKWKEMMQVDVSEYLSVNIVMTILVTILAVICAVQGFSYLFRRQKMDMYMSVPVSKERRFAVIYLNGILLFAIPYLFSILIGLCIAAGNGILTATAVKAMLYSYLMYIVYYAAVYNITIIAVMFTGNVLVSICATGVFLFYEIIVKVICMTFCAAFYRTYTSYSEDYTMFFSPVIMMFQNTEIEHEGLVTVPILIHQTGPVIVKILIIAVIAGIIGYLLYTRRPTESSSRAIAFDKTKPFIKVALMLPISLLAGVLFYSITNSNIAMTIFGFVIGILFSQCMMEIIFAYDLKAAFKHPLSGVAGAVLVFGIFVVFKFDLTGFDRWVPDAEKVESVAVDIPTMGNGGMRDYENGRWISSTEYCWENMKYTDTKKICELMEKIVEEEQEETEDGQKMLWMNIKYCMTNGKEKYRSVHLPVDEYLEQLNEVVSSEEYKKGAYPLLNEELNKKQKVKSISFSNGVYSQETSAEEMELVLANYVDDMAQYDLKTIVNENPIGIVNIEMESLNTNVRQYYSLPVYGSFEKTNAYVKDKGYLADWREDTDKIESVTISRWDTNGYESGEKKFESKEEIEQILPAIVPNELAYSMYNTMQIDYSYDVYVNFEDEIAYFVVDSSLLPDFAK